MTHEIRLGGWVPKGEGVRRPPEFFQENVSTKCLHPYDRWITYYSGFIVKYLFVSIEWAGRVLLVVCCRALNKDVVLVSVVISR